MERTPVESSTIAGVGHDPATKILEVEFKGGGVYQYLEVPAAAHGELMAAESIGKHHNAHIKGTFDFVKLPVSVEPEPASV